MSIRLSLKYRIAIVIFLLETVVMGMALWQTLQYSLNASREQSGTTEVAIMDLLSGMSRIALLTEEYADLQPYLENLRDEPRVVRAMLADTRGRVVVSTNAADVGTAFTAVLAQPSDGGHLWRRREIRNAAGPLGELAVGFSNAALIKAYRDSLNLGIIIAVSGMTIIAIAGILMGYLLTRRLGRITLAAQRFASGELEVATGIQGHDELGDLARSFDKMAKSVSEHQRDLSDSEKYHRMLFGQSRVGQVLSRPSGEIVDANPAYASMIGRSVEETLKLTTSYITPQEYLEEEHRQLNTLRTTGHYGPYEKEYIHKDGHRVPVSLQGSLLEKDNETFVWSNVDDITERKAAENELLKHREHLQELVAERTCELQQAQEELLRNERLATLGQLTATVSHELRNPLSVIRSSLYLIRELCDADNETAKNALQRLDRNVSRCDGIIDELLDYTRIKILDRRPVLLDNWLRSIVEDQSIPAGVQVEMEFGLDHFVSNIDGERLRRAVINVIENACHAAQSGAESRQSGNVGRIGIKTRRNHERFEIVISDNGPGMAATVLEHIYEPLFSTKGFGVGLGMPVAKQIMEQHRGGIDVATEEGRGTAITLWLSDSEAE